jgi:type IV pilus assembly protein PilV
MNTRSTQYGTTLIEVLVAAIIIGIGLLGISALQIKALQHSTNAEHRAKATDIAWALADRMRANLQADTDTGTGNQYVESPVPSCPVAFAGSVCSMAPGASGTAGVTQCTAAEMAAYDLFQMRCADGLGAEQVLPAGTLEVICIDKNAANGDPCDPGSELQITVTWETRSETLDTGSTGDFITLSVIPGQDPF